MNRNRLLAVGLVALLLAGFVSFAVFQIVNKATQAQREQTQVVAAAVDVPLGVPLERKQLKMVKADKGNLPPGTFKSIDELAGRGLIYPLTRNEVVLESKLASKEAGAGLPAMIPDGMRAVSVKVNDVVSVAGFVQPGTRVDVLLTGQPDSRNQEENVTTVTVLENVKVLAAGTQLQQNAKGEAVNVPVITLLCSPDEAQRLTLAATQGKIQLTLRNPVDRNHAEPAALKNAVLYRTGAPDEKPQPNVVNPPPKPHKVVIVQKKSQPAPYLVEVIRGDKRDDAKF
ncbi:MAG: Flp pilus assembly protein CpaB [Acidobacteriales bacterium]|nr:Flp pilus assembly protein CpaB [Terriglobales bacterium]